MIDSKLLDSSVWLAYLGKKLCSEIIESKATLFLSVLSIFEIKKKLITDKISKKEIEENINFIKEKSILVPVTIEIIEKAVNIASEKKIPTVDSIIYASALSNNVNLVTLDNDFRGLERVEILAF